MTESKSPTVEHDPQTHIMGADGKVKPMPTGAWTAALTEGGNLKRSQGLLVEAEA